MAKKTRADYQRALRIGEQSLARRTAGMSAADKRRAQTLFYADPRIQRIRQGAGLAPVQTRQQAIQATARRVVQEERGSAPDLGLAFRAGIRRSLFGVPERLAAAGLRFLPSAITGNTSDASYDDILDLVRARTDEELKLSKAGNIIGQIVGGVGGGSAAVRGAQWVGRAAQGSRALPAAARVAGNVLERLTTLNRGARAANAAKLTTQGGALGAAQAAGEGSDVSRGTLYGAGGALAVGGALKGAGWLARPVRDLFRTTGAAEILRRFTNSSAEEISQAADDFRTRTGAEPTVYELLPLEDREALRGAIKLMPGAARERLAQSVRARAANMGPELAARAEQATEGQTRFLARNMAQDLARSRNAANPTAEELALAKRAVRDPTELENLRATEARNIMEPFDDMPAYETVNDLLPTAPRNDNGTIIEEISDPEVATTIRSAAGTLKLKPDHITVRDVSDIIASLRGDIGRGGIEGRAAQRAINHLEDIVARDHPEVGEAMARMRDAYAARSRMLEGVSEGRQARLREDVPVTTGKGARKVRNAYDTPEGAAGRLAGQRAEIVRDFGDTPGRAVGAAQRIAEGPQLQTALERNLGPRAAGDIAGASGAQTESARRLASLLPEQSGTNENVDLADLTRAITALSPSALPSTKIWAVAQLQRLLQGISGKKANQIVEALFSQDPAAKAKAYKLLNNSTDTGKEFLRQLNRAVLGSYVGQSLGSKAAEPSPAAPENPDSNPALLEPGNIDLNNRPVVHNPDGTISTVRSITLGVDDGFYLIPTVVNGRVVSDDEAVAHFRETGEHLGKFRDEASANTYAEQLHESQAQQYSDDEPGPWQNYQDDQGGEEGPWSNYGENVPYGQSIVQSVYPGAHVTDAIRDPESDLGRANPGSFHNTTDGAVDVRPIPGMTFEEFIAGLEAAGHQIIEAKDEVKHPSKHATGKHWHVVFA